MNTLSGIYGTRQRFYGDGNKAEINSPENSAEYGIGMVHQHFKFVERFTAMDIRIKF